MKGSSKRVDRRFSRFAEQHWDLREPCGHEHDDVFYSSHA